MPKLYCRSCEEIIFLSPDTIEAIEEGEIETSEYCRECQMGPEYDMSYEQYSDADPGL